MNPIKRPTRKSRKTGINATFPKTAMKEFSENKELAKIAKNMFHKKVDQQLIRKNVRLSQHLFRILATASPQSTANLISGIAVDLADFVEIGEEHRRRVQELSKMKFPKDKKRFEDLLYEFEIRLVVHAEWHTRHLKRRLAKLKHDLELG